MAPELAIVPALNEAVVYRPGIRVERVHPSSLAAYGTVGIHDAERLSGSGEQVVDFVAGINYRPELGLDPFRLYAGGGYGVLQYQSTGAIRLAVDLHGGAELLRGVAGLRVELRYANAGRYGDYAPVALVVGAFVDI